MGGPHGPRPGPAPASHPAAGTAEPAGRVGEDRSRHRSPSRHLPGRWPHECHRAVSASGAIGANKVYSCLIRRRHYLIPWAWVGRDRGARGRGPECDGKGLTHLNLSKNLALWVVIAILLVA